MNAVKIPYDQLSNEALQGVIEEFVTRDGTDYGEVQIPLGTKITQVLKQLKSKDAFIVFDQHSVLLDLCIRTPVVIATHKTREPKEINLTRLGFS